jgi:hypothetical protein
VLLSLQTSEVSPDAKASTLILWPYDQIDEQDGQSAARQRDVDKLQNLQSDEHMHGRVVARECKHRSHEEICTLVHSSLSQPTAASVPSIPAALGCLSAALHELCDGKVRACMCMLPTLAQGSVVGGSREAGASLLASLLAVALMQLRAEYVWIRKIAVVDCSMVGEEGLSAHAEMFNDPDLLFLRSPLPSVAGSSSAGKKSHVAESGAAAGAAAPSGAKKSGLKSHFEDVALKVADFQPQIFVCCLHDNPKAPGEGGKGTPVDGGVDMAWVGKWAKTVSAKYCKGRSIAVSGFASNISDFLQGMI